MSFSRFAAFVSAAVLAGWTVTASAADGEYGRSGPYLGAGGSYGLENFDGGNAANSWGYDLKAGYRFNEIFALEAGWQHFLSFDTDPTGDINLWMIGASAKAFLLDGPIQPFVLAGMGWENADGSGKSDTALGFRFGAGIDLYASRNWAISAEAGYLLSTGKLSDLDVIPVSLGVTYRFY